MYAAIPQAHQNAARVLARLLLADGCSVSVSDGDEGFFVQHCTDETELFDALGEMEDDSVYWYDTTGARLGWFYLIWVNDADELIADHTDNAVCNALFADLAAFT